MPTPKGGWTERLGPVICEKCGNQEDRNAPTQRFCISCAQWRERLRKRQWQNLHPREAPTQRIERQRKRSLHIREFGSTISVGSAKGANLLPARKDAFWTFRIEFPFEGTLSKNAIPNIGMISGRPFFYVRQQVKAKRNSIAWLIREQIGAGNRWPRGKTWLDIVVQKPKHNYDAINVVDTVCDAIKDGLEVDDAWFCIGYLDWEIVKTNPQVFVQVSAYHHADQAICSSCGQIKYLDGFSRNKNAEKGITTICYACSSRISNAKGLKRKLGRINCTEP